MVGNSSRDKGPPEEGLGLTLETAVREVGGMNQTEFYGPEWDWANTAINTGNGDGFLLDLIELAEDGIGAVIGVMANAMIVVGTVAPPEAVAEELDFQRRRLAEASESPSDASPEEWSETVDAFSSVNKRKVEALRDGQEKFEAAEAGPWDYSSRPQGPAREALELNARYNLTLSSAQIFAPGQVGIMRLKVLRIALSQVTGWWPIPTDEKGLATFRLFSTDGE